MPNQKNNDKKQLDALVALVPNERKHIAVKLAQEIVFMSQTLNSLRSDIAERGAVEMFKQGKQEFLRENPALKAYNTTVQRYSLLYKQFADLLPEPVVDGNELYDFLVQEL